MKIASTNLIKIHQWERYCFENFLLDSDTIYDTCQTLSFRNNISRGEIKNLLEEIAIAELTHFIARKVYSNLEPENAGYRNDLDKIDNYLEIGNKLLDKLNIIKHDLSSLDSSNWVQEFNASCFKMEDDLREEWRDKWYILSNGKRVIKELHKKLGATCSETDFKKQIVLQMKLKSSDNWRIIDNILDSLIKGV